MDRLAVVGRADPASSLAITRRDSLPERPGRRTVQRPRKVFFESLGTCR